MPKLYFSWKQTSAYMEPYRQKCPEDLLFLFKIFLTFIYFWETERDTAQAGEEQREGETKNPKQTPGSELPAQSLTRGSNSRTVRSWPERKSATQATEPPRRPPFLYLSFGVTPRLLQIQKEKHLCTWMFKQISSHNLTQTSLCNIQL